MKKWNTPVVEELSINETAHNWTGIHRDGGYIGDCIISGHLSWTKPGEEATQPTQPTQPSTPAEDPDKLS